MKNIWQRSTLSFCFISLLVSVVFSSDMDCPIYSQFGQDKYLDLPFHSQFGQDKYLYENCFGEKRNGVFIDIGACEPVLGNNTYFFEMHLGWTGICIEPIQEFYEKLKANRSCICINGCVSNRIGPISFLRVRGYPCALSGIIENYHPGHVNRIDSEISLWGGSKETITIESYNLNQLLTEKNIYHIDYLSIDVEGSEMSILRTIDFARFDIDVIGIENNYGEHFEQFLVPLGYKKIAIVGVDEIYRKRKDIR